MPVRPPSRLPLLAALALLGLAGCSKEHVPAVAAQPPSLAAAGPAAVATFRGERISAAQLDEALAGQLQQLEDQYARQRYDVRRKGLEQLVAERLLQAEARRRGIPKEQLLKEEVEAKVRPPSSEEVRRVYEANASRLPEGATLEDVRPQVVELLTREARQERTRALLARLRREADVRILLPAPRKPVEAVGPSRGPADAPVTVVAFLDFECPYCARAHATVGQLLEKYPGQVRLVARHFPLSFHAHALLAALAAQCAHEQGRFWEYQDTLFQNQGALEEAALKGYAESLGLDTQRFSGCLRSARAAKQVSMDLEAGSRVGVTATPTFFINGIVVSGAQPLEELSRLVDDELSGGYRQSSSPTPMPNVPGEASSEAESDQSSR